MDPKRVRIAAAILQDRFGRRGAISGPSSVIQDTGEKRHWLERLDVYPKPEAVSEVNYGADSPQGHDIGAATGLLEWQFDPTWLQSSMSSASHSDSRRPLGPAIHPLQDTQNVKVEFWRLLKWMDACQQCSSKTRGEWGTGGNDLFGDTREELQLPSRIIDVYRRRITQTPTNCQYVALSYVWGNSDSIRLHQNMIHLAAQDGFLDAIHRLPRTIHDAISFCREIGHRYLWVDSLCIVQDTDDKHRHLQMIESIYRGASLTLVAAAGDHADYGLPGFGVPFQRTLGQPSSFGTAVDSSAWNGRAWTYQERLLSRRMIIIARDQIYFQCDHGRAQGDSLFDPHDIAMLKLRSLAAEDDYRIDMRNRVNFNVYARIVKEYMLRTLTYPHDIENAFAGVAKIFQLMFGGSEVLHGTPISILTLALLWYPQKELLPRFGEGAFKQPENDSPTDRRPTIREPLPSWSWVGSIGPVEFISTRNLAARTINKLIWVDPLDKDLPLDTENFGPPAHWHDVIKSDDWLRQVSPRREIYWVKRNGNRSHWFCHPMVSSMPNTRLPLSRDTGALHFKSSIAEFMGQKSTTGNTLQLDLLLPLGQDDSRHDARAGVVTLDQGTIGLVPIVKVAVILLSQTTLMEGQQDPAYKPETMSYSGTPGSRGIALSLARETAGRMFDNDVYGAETCWPLYNVMVVGVGNGQSEGWESPLSLHQKTMCKARRSFQNKYGELGVGALWNGSQMRGGRVCRLGIGKVHIHAFDKVAKHDVRFELV